MSDDHLSHAEADLRAVLADLSLFEYGQQRHDIAKRFGITVLFLDRIYKVEHAKKKGAVPEFEPVEPSDEDVAGDELLNAIEKEIKRYIVITENALVTVALWVLHTHAHAFATISPILLITAATKGCGKSTLLDVLSKLVPRPMTSAACTPAALYRSAKKIPTVLCDEGDTYLGEDRRLVTFFNAGHRPGVPFWVCEGDDNKPTPYPSWCPKAIAMIGMPVFSTITDRSIIIELQRKLGHEDVADFSLSRAHPTLSRLRSQAARWAQDHEHELREADPELPAGFQNRLADNWRPLLAIADVAGGKWPERARQAAQALRRTSDDGLEILLLEDLRELFRDRENFFTDDVVVALRELTHRPWNDIQKGRGISGRWLARTLIPFGIEPDRISLGDTRKRGYVRAQFDDAWNRYLEPTPTSPGSQDPSVPSKCPDGGRVDGTDTSHEPMQHTVDFTPADPFEVLEP